MKIFLISGKAGSGKNEAAKIIKRNLEKSIITSFSKYIKLFAVEMTNWDGDENNKPRTFLQEMGDTLRSIDENFLTKRLMDDMKVYEKYYNNVIITDARLLNEIRYFLNNGSYEVITIRINSPYSKRELNTNEKSHMTEVELDNYNIFDFIIENNFDDELEAKIKMILEELK